MSSETAIEFVRLTLGVVCLLTLAASGVLFAMTLSEALDPQRCPSDHVWVATGEIPQAGCMPLGTARELGAWP